jgi:hypothetical protein
VGRTARPRDGGGTFEREDAGVAGAEEFGGVGGELGAETEVGISHSLLTSLPAKEEQIICYLTKSN